jgi:uncharacterized protein (TIGR02271 family)
MNEEAIAAVFDSPEHADAAVRDLIAAAVAENAIARHTGAEGGRSSPGDGVEVARPREEGFWSRLFGGERDYDHQVYDRSLASGSTVVTLRVSEDQVALVTEILDRHHPIDIDERASAYGLTATMEGMSGTQSTGIVETAYETPVARSAETNLNDGDVPVSPVYPATEPDTGAVAGTSTARHDLAARATEEETLRLAEERLTVGKRLVNRGARIRRYVVETPVEEQINLREERVVVDRRPVTGAVAADTADFSDRTIEMAEMREEAVVAKTAYVTEEVRLRKEAVDHVETVRDTVRREEVEVERLPHEPGGTR